MLLDVSTQTPDTIAPTTPSIDQVVRVVRDSTEAETFLSIVMPAFNEARTIRAAVQHVLGAWYPCPIELIVVDDGSHDDTGSLLDDIDDERLTVVQHPRNLGKGAAVMTGIKQAVGTHLIPFDADLEYSAHDVARMLEPIIEGRSRVVYGARLFGQNTVYQSYRYKVGNQAMTLAANILYDSALSDLHTCLKLIPLDMLRSMDLSEAGFGLDTEVTAHVLRMGARPFEVPVSYYSRSRADGKKISWRDGVRCLRVLGRVRLTSSESQVVTRGMSVLRASSDNRSRRRSPVR